MKHETISVRISTHRGKPVFLWGSGSGKRRRTIDHPDDPKAVERQRIALLVELQAGPVAKQRNYTLEEHVTDFIRFVAANANDKVVRMKEQRLRRILEAAKITRVEQLTAGKIETAISEMRCISPANHKPTKKLLSDNSKNHYRRAVKQFSLWLYDEGRTETHLLKKLKTRKVVDHVERDRFHPDELRKLIQAAAASPKVIESLDGRMRSWLYLLAAQTGYRRGELGCMKPESFDLTADPPMLTVPAGYTKNGDLSSQPLPPALVPALREFLAGFEPGELLFPGLDRAEPRKCCKMIHRDMETAGIPKLTATGKRDFHSLRNSYISGLCDAGLPVPEVQRLARHSDVRITMGYAKPGVDLRKRAVAALPDLPVPVREGTE